MLYELDLSDKLRRGGGGGLAVYACSILTQFSHDYLQVLWVAVIPLKPYAREILHLLIAVNPDWFYLTNKALAATAAATPQASSARVASLPLVWKAEAQLSVTHGAMSRTRRGAWKCSLAITFTLTVLRAV